MAEAVGIGVASEQALEARIAAALARAHRACDRIDSLATRHRDLCAAVEQALADLDRIGGEGLASGG
jgi:hypothetical protein